MIVAAIFCFRRYIYGNFTRQVDMGMLQVIAPNFDAYPDFKNLPKTLNDPPERLQWRAKQVFDTAYVMHYCIGKADHYMRIEDDVWAAKRFVKLTCGF